MKREIEMWNLKPRFNAIGWVDNDGLGGTDLAGHPGRGALDRFSILTLKDSLPFLPGFLFYCRPFCSAPCMDAGWPGP